MNPTRLFGILLTLGFIYICSARPLNEKDEAKLMAQVPKWKKAPTIDEIVEGNVSREDNITTYKFKYTSEDGYLCDAMYAIKVDEEGRKADKHDFDCAMIPTTEEPDFE